MELGDRYLVVQRAAIGANPAKHGSHGHDRNGGGGSGAANFTPDLSKVSTSILAAASAGDEEPTRVLQMLNMVTPEELINDAEYEEIIEDIKDECGKYGSILDVKVPRPAVGDNKKIDVKATEALEDVGKVFVMYEGVEMTKVAMAAIA